MKSKQVILRLETLILKDTQRINGYRLLKGNQYKITIRTIEASRKRKQKALEYVKRSKATDFKWAELCLQFGFRPYINPKPIIFL